ncbi:hypothetical protein [Kitasatospora cheerisanensis]|uniref:Uncharacterized protein n=1 Tax=Kitasatospora cheerisanensis KCTC 2395 TaxID=1348663 RepID=A0A066YWG6_9ACTN|nr:hypothetical protein [Kitasatospora cheerisanensis]KDN84314.1 hypothetical protein KCH_41050 [Kitasatospora cheerisanensis KCTC 2395]
MNRTETVKEHDVQERAPEALFVREAMDRVTDGLAEPLGLTARAVRDGRRRRLRSRVAVGGAAACTAALAVTGIGALPGTGGGPGPVGVQAGNTTVPRVFPTVTFTPTASPAAPPAPLPEAERQRIDAFRQATARTLQDLLPPAVGDIRLVADDVSSYLAESPLGSHFVRFSVRPAPGAATERTCTPGPVDKLGTCRVVRLSDGTPVAVRVVPEGNGSVTLTMASFHVGGSDVSVSVSPDGRTNTSAPVTADQMAAFVGSPQVLDLVREADLHPVEEPQVSHNEGENR